MSVFDAFLLGLIQGLTEFLPISSSGHLVFYQKILGYDEPMIAFDVAVHIGTLLAVLAYFFKDVLGMAKDGIGFIPKLTRPKEWDAYFQNHVYALTLGFAILSTIVTIAIVVIFKDAVHMMFTSVRVVGVAWLVMGVFLILSQKYRAGSRDLYQMSHSDAFVIGIAQGIAVIPGISRSGMTILAGMILGLDGKTAAKYSFLIGLFAIAGAGVLEAKEGLELLSEAPIALMTGFFVSAAVGYLAILILMRFIEKGKFFIFGFYCCFMGLLVCILDLTGVF